MGQETTKTRKGWTCQVVGAKEEGSVFFHLAEALELCILEGEGMYVKEVCYAFLQLTLLLL